MARILKSTEAGVTSQVPGTYVRRVVEGATKVPVNAVADSSVLLMPIYAPKGPTDELVMFEGLYRDFIAVFGDYDVVKHGQPTKLVHDHIKAGGRWCGVNLRAEDATSANIVLSLTSTPLTKAFYVDASGVTYSKKPTSIPTKEITINTYALATTFQNITGIKKLTELDLAVKPLTVMTSPSSMVMPFLALMSNGRGKYGNNIEIAIEKSSQIVKCAEKPYSVYNMAMIDRSTNTVIDKYPFTHGRDVYDANGMSYNIGDLLDEFNTQFLHRQYTDSIDKFDDVFVTMLEDIGGQIKTIMEDATTPVPELEVLYTKIMDFKTIYEANDNTIPAFNLIDPFGSLAEIDGENESIFASILEMPSDRIIATKLAMGDDGYLKKMKRFDWDFQTEIAGTTVKVVEDLYKKFYQGVITEDIFDYNRCPADYVQDPDFPLSVKMAIDQLCSNENRLDVTYIMNAPTAIQRIDELKVLNKSFTADNINRFKFVNAGLTRDANSMKWLLTTVSGALTPILTSFFRSSLAPIASRYIDSFKDRSVTMLMNNQTDKGWCYSNDWSYITEMPDGYMLDGAAGSFKGYDHPAKELYNMLLGNRLIRDVMNYLEKNRHKLQSISLATFVKEVNEIVLKPYQNKGLTCSFKMGYANDRDRKAGTVTDELYIEGPRTNKRHNLLIRLGNQQ